MRESYIVKNDNLKGYYNSFTNERSIYTHGTRKTFSNGYLYSCSDSVITSMKNKLNEKYNAIDKGYQAIDKWLADYIDDFNNIENSLKTGSVISNDSSTRAQLQKVQNKNDAKVLNATDIVYNIKNNKNSSVNSSSAKNVQDTYNILSQLDEEQLKFVRGSLGLSDSGKTGKTIDELRKELSEKTGEDYSNASNDKIAMLCVTNGIDIQRLKTREELLKETAEKITSEYGDMKKYAEVAQETGFNKYLSHDKGSMFNYSNIVNMDDDELRVTCKYLNINMYEDMSDDEMRRALQKHGEPGKDYSRYSSMQLYNAVERYGLRNKKDLGKLQDEISKALEDKEMNQYLNVKPENEEQKKALIEYEKSLDFSKYQSMTTEELKKTAKDKGILYVNLFTRDGLIKELTLTDWGVSTKYGEKYSFDKVKKMKEKHDWDLYLEQKAASLGFKSVKEMEESEKKESEKRLMAAEEGKKYGRIWEYFCLYHDDGTWRDYANSNNLDSEKREELMVLVNKGTDKETIDRKILGIDNRSTWEKITGTVVDFGVSFGEGISYAAEGLVDGTAWLYNITKEYYAEEDDKFHAAMDYSSGKISAEEYEARKEEIGQSYNKNIDKMEEQIAVDYTTEGYNEYVWSSDIGQYAIKNSIDHETVSGLGTSLGEVAVTASGMNYVGLASPFLIGAGKGTQSSLQSGAHGEKVIAGYLLGGAYNAAQYGVGAKFAKMPYGSLTEKVAVNVMVDSVDAATTIPVQTFIQTASNAGYTDPKTGEYVKFSDNDSFADRYGALFEANGGIEATAESTAKGIIFSLGFNGVPEVVNLARGRKYQTYYDVNKGKVVENGIYGADKIEMEGPKKVTPAEDVAPKTDINAPKNVDEKIKTESTPDKKATPEKVTSDPKTDVSPEKVEEKLETGKKKETTEPKKAKDVEKENVREVDKTKTDVDTDKIKEKLDSDAKKKAEAEKIAKEKAEAEAKQKAAEEKAKKLKEQAEAEAKKKAEAEKIAKEKAEAEAKQKAAEEKAKKLKEQAEAEAKKKAEAEKIAKEKAEAEAKQKAAEEKAKKLKEQAEAEAKKKAEAEKIAKEKAEAEAKQKAAEEKAKKLKEQAEAEAKKKAEAEKIAKEKVLIQKLTTKANELFKVTKEKLNEMKSNVANKAVITTKLSLAATTLKKGANTVIKTPKNIIKGISKLYKTTKKNVLEIKQKIGDSVVVKSSTKAGKFLKEKFTDVKNNVKSASGELKNKVESVVDNIGKVAKERAGIETKTKKTLKEKIFGGKEKDTMWHNTNEEGKLIKTASDGTKLIYDLDKLEMRDLDGNKAFYKNGEYLYEEPGTGKLFRKTKKGKEYIEVAEPNKNKFQIAKDKLINITKKKASDIKKKFGIDDNVIYSSNKETMKQVNEFLGKEYKNGTGTSNWKKAKDGEVYKIVKATDGSDLKYSLDKLEMIDVEGNKAFYRNGEHLYEEPGTGKIFRKTKKGKEYIDTDLKIKEPRKSLLEKLFGKKETETSKWHTDENGELYKVGKAADGTEIKYFLDRAEMIDAEGNYVKYRNGEYIFEDAEGKLFRRTKKGKEYLENNTKTTDIREEVTKIKQEEPDVKVKTEVEPAEPKYVPVDEQVRVINEELKSGLFGTVVVESFDDISIRDIGKLEYPEGIHIRLADGETYEFKEYVTHQYQRLKTKNLTLDEQIEVGNFVAKYGRKGMTIETSLSELTPAKLQQIDPHIELIIDGKKYSVGHVASYYNALDSVYTKLAQQGWGSEDFSHLSMDEVFMMDSYGIPSKYYIDQKIAHYLELSGMSEADIRNVCDVNTNYSSYKSILEAAKTEYEAKFKTKTKTDVFFDKNRVNGSYGADQGYLKRLYYYKDEATGILYQETKIKSLPPEIRQRLHKKATTEYFRIKGKLVASGFSPIDAASIITGLDTAGACSYAAFVNHIFSIYKDNPVKFYRDFGIPMYTNIDGRMQLNYGEFLVDLYVDINKIENGGRIIDGTRKTIVYNSEGGLNAKRQLGLSGAYGEEIRIINGYLQRKGVPFGYESQHLFGTIGYPYNQPVMPMSLKEIKNWATTVERNLEEGHQCLLGISNNQYSEVKMHSLDDKGKVVTTNTWNEQSVNPNEKWAGHALHITAVTKDGFVVSSWGERYLIKFDELTTGQSFRVDIATMN